MEEPWSLSWSSSGVLPADIEEEICPTVRKLDRRSSLALAERSLQSIRIQPPTRIQTRCATSTLDRSIFVEDLRTAPRRIEAEVRSISRRCHRPDASVRPSRTQLHRSTGRVINTKRIRSSARRSRGGSPPGNRTRFSYTLVGIHHRTLCPDMS